MVYTKTVILVLALFIMLTGMPMSVLAQTEAGLILKWHFEGDVKDSSGNGNDGIIYGAKFVDEKFGKALGFNGTSDYVGLNYIKIGQSITVLAWVKSATSIWNTDCWIASARGENGFIICPISGTKQWSGWISDKNAYPQTIGSNIPNDITQWHQYGVMYDYNAQKGYMIFDGGIVAAKGMGLIRTNGTNIDFGRDQGTVSYGNGLIDEVRIYNRALSAEEVKEQFDGKQTVPTALTITKTSSTYSIEQGQTTSIQTVNYSSVNISKTSSIAPEIKETIIKNLSTGVLFLNGSALSISGHGIKMITVNGNYVDTRNFYVNVTNEKRISIVAIDNDGNITTKNISLTTNINSKTDPSNSPNWIQIFGVIIALIGLLFGPGLIEKLKIKYRKQ